MPQEQPNNPLHGITLKAIVEDLVARHGFPVLAERIPIGCFANNPSVRSSLKFLRRAPWARERVEKLWLEDQRLVERKRKRNQRRAARRAYKAEQQAREAAEPSTEVHGKARRRTGWEGDEAG